MPLSLNPAVAATLAIVMLELPLLVIDVVNEDLLPSLTLPKFKAVGLAPSEKVAAAPVPARLMTSGEGVPFVVRVMLPDTVVAEDGVKTALNVVLPPAGMVVDVERPVWVKAEPATATCEKVRVALPPFWRVMVWELLEPTVTVPKLTLVGLAEISGLVPVPVRLIVRGELAALLVMVMLAPLTAPADVGSNVTVNVAD